jgi:hypothetical protein
VLAFEKRVVDLDDNPPNGLQSAASALAAITSTVMVLMVTVDVDHRVRNDLIQTDKHAVWKGRDWAVKRIVGGVWCVVAKLRCHKSGGDEGRSLLANSDP